MWLASISHWRNGRNIPYQRWGAGVRRVGHRLARNLLCGVGDPDVERRFAMVMTLCVHRAVSDDELAVCGTDRAVHLAGPAVEEISRTPGYPPLPLTAQRCERGTWAFLQTPHGRLRIPGDCADCAPCLARLEHEKP